MFPRWRDIPGIRIGKDSALSPCILCRLYKMDKQPSILWYSAFEHILKKEIKCSFQFKKKKGFKNGIDGIVPLPLEHIMAVIHAR